MRKKRRVIFSRARQNLIELAAKASRVVAWWWWIECDRNVPYGEIAPVVAAGMRQAVDDYDGRYHKDFVEFARPYYEHELRIMFHAARAAGTDVHKVELTLEDWSYHEAFYGAAEELAEVFTKWVENRDTKEEDCFGRNRLRAITRHRQRPLKVLNALRRFFWEIEKCRR